MGKNLVVRSLLFGAQSCYNASENSYSRITMGFLSRFARPAKPPAHVMAFDALAAQARQPEFFTAGRIPDTTEGRFELLLLHLFIVLYAVRQQPDAVPFKQALFDAAFTALDWNLREIGVGDMTVGKKIKRMAEIFYGRVTQYSAALEAGEAALAEQLGATLYPAASPPPGREVLDSLATYVAEAVAALAATAPAILADGQVTFPDFRVSRKPA